MNAIELIVAACLADVIFGDPERLPHPVRAMGWLISFLERHLRRGNGPAGQRAAGVLLFLVVVGISWLIPFAALKLCLRWNPLLGGVVWVYLAYTTLAARNLADEARSIHRQLTSGSLPGARRRLARIVGRDTGNLSRERVVTAAVESISENTSDGVVAPLFYLSLGGPALAMAYKAVNTLDSMVGHKNDRYLYFGWFSARMDDAANFIPARLTGLLIAAAAWLTGHGFRDAFRTMLRDGGKHDSPNSGRPEAAMAGALGVRLGGLVTYQGETMQKPFFGMDRNQPVPAHIMTAVKISSLASVLALSIGIFLLWLIL